MESSFNELALLLIVLFPMAGAVLNGIGGSFFKADKKVVGLVAVCAVAASFGLAVYSFINLVGGHEQNPAFALTHHVYEWFSVQVPHVTFVNNTKLVTLVTVPVNVRFTMDALSGLMTVMITGIGLLIHVYSLGYMSEEPSFARFFAYLNLFMASMLILVLGSNLPLMFVGWEGVGVCSYLLIGFWFENPAYAAAGKKAFITNRIGDFGVLIGMFVLLNATESFEFTEINSHAGALAMPFMLGGLTLSASIATVAALFLFLGCTGKSAQLPLYVWLPDAMAGPTPVSALIHAATMVTSGVYLCCRLSPVFVQSPTAMAVIAVVGTLTALIAASIALVQNQLKKVLAYSTVSQLGFMFAAVGVGAFSAGIFHVFTHAFFKACLFLGAGSVMHAVHAHGDADFRQIGGMKKWMPITNATFFVSCLAIAGIPGTAGFFSKDMILHGALNSSSYFDFAPWLGQVVFGALCLAAFGTAFYMFRLYYLAFTGEFRGGHGHDDHGHGHDDHGHHAEPHESEWPMTLPLIVLGTGALLVGWLGMPAWAHLPDFWNEWLDGVVAGLPDAHKHHEDAGTGMVALIAGTIAGVGGMVLALVKYWNKPWQAAENLSPLHQFLMDKWRMDEFYDAVLIRPMTLLAKVAAGIDRVAVDGLTKLTAGGIRGLGWLATRLQTGEMHAYGAGMAFGIVGLTWWVAYPHPHIEGAKKGDAVHFVAGAGLGYEYRWDFESDGVFDTEWGADKRDVSHAFDAANAVAAQFVLVEVAGRTKGPYTLRLGNGEAATEINTRYLGDEWKQKPGNTPPALRYEDGIVYVRPGASAITVDGVQASGAEIPVKLGSIVMFGTGVTSRLDAVVRSTLAVRNVFGNTSETKSEFVVQAKAQAHAARVFGSDSAVAQRSEAQ